MLPPTTPTACTHTHPSTSTHPRIGSPHHKSTHPHIHYSTDLFIRPPLHITSLHPSIERGIDRSSIRPSQNTNFIHPPMYTSAESTIHPFLFLSSRFHPVHHTATFLPSIHISTRTLTFVHRPIHLVHENAVELVVALHVYHHRSSVGSAEICNLW